ncbi:hypothetical protein llap_12918 [Limosa lapponica baueri]|uniref:Uncharacterized protein n=1 Tax=Limosa lapponica baueri TaxID=1758121 RepID=A0A2I0TSJ8_LIMLA|nr:hypothetical protein llap_12918 [Limosa lapponica baueri]
MSKFELQECQNSTLKNRGADVSRLVILWPPSLNRKPHMQTMPAGHSFPKSQQLETFTFMSFANQNLNQISSNPPQEQDDGSVAKTTDWDPRDLKVKSKCAGSFRLNFRPS